MNRQVFTAKPKMPAQQKPILQEEILQAVVVADSFDQNYQPLTLMKPRCLLPLANVPLIELVKFHSYHYHQYEQQP